MSVSVSDVKEIGKEIGDFLKDEKLVHRLPTVMQTLSSVILLFVLFLSYWNFLASISISLPPMFSDSFCTVLHKFTLPLLIAWYIYDIFLSKWVLFYALYKLTDKTQDKIMPLIFGVEAALALVASALYLLSALNEIIRFAHNVGSLPSGCINVYGVAIVYIAIKLLRWIYQGKLRFWKEISKDYSLYYDCNKKRIAEKDLVLYHNKRYKVNNEKGEWTIVADIYSTNKDKDSHLLEDAVKDATGNLEILTPSKINIVN